MNYKEILKGIVNIINTTEKSDIGFANICSYIGENCPELAVSEDEKFRKYILKCCEETIQANDRGLELSMDTTKKLKNWLEKQSDKDKLIKELGEYKVKYTQEVLSQQLEKQGNKGKLNNEDICEGCNNFKGCVTCVDGDQWAQYK